MSNNNITSLSRDTDSETVLTHHINNVHRDLGGANINNISFYHLKRALDKSFISSNDILSIMS